MDTSYPLDSNQHFRQIIRGGYLYPRICLVGVPQVGIEPTTLACHTAYKYHALRPTELLGLFSGAGRGHGFFIESESLCRLLCSSLGSRRYDMLWWRFFKLFWG